MMQFDVWVHFVTIYFLTSIFFSLIVSFGMLLIYFCMLSICFYSLFILCSIIKILIHGFLTYYRLQRMVNRLHRTIRKTQRALNLLRRNKVWLQKKHRQLILQVMFYWCIPDILEITWTWIWLICFQYFGFSAFQWFSSTEILSQCLHFQSSKLDSVNIDWEFQ